MAYNYVKLAVAITNSEWTPVVAPMDCNYFAIRCATSHVTTRTDAADAATEDALEEDVQDGVIGGYLAIPSRQRRFRQGETVVYVKSDATTAVLITTWVL